MIAIVISSFRRGMLATIAAAALAATASAQDHLLLSEICAVPSAGEFIEIYNPTNATIDLTNYYIADNIFYARTSANPPFGTPAPTDFVVRFPSGATIPAGGRRVLTFNPSGFFATYGFHADYKMPPDDFTTPPAAMIPAWGGSSGAGPTLQDLGEALYLYHWDQAYDLVKDVDIVRFGQPDASNQIASKTGLNFDGPDRDLTPSFYLNEAILMGTMSLNAGSGFSYKRRYAEGLNEQACGGNGITGNQELSENIQINWDGNVGPLTAPTPGIGPDFPNPPGQCYADTNLDANVNVTDLLAVISAWGACVGCPGKNCVADVAPSTCNDCLVNVTDLLAVISNWGPCT